MKTNKNTLNVWGQIFCQFCILFLIFLCFTIKWGINNFGNVGMEEIIFTISMPLNGVENSFLLTYLKDAIVPTVICFCIEFILLCPSEKLDIFYIN